MGVSRGQLGSSNSGTVRLGLIPFEFRISFWSKRFTPGLALLIYCTGAVPILDSTEQEDFFPSFSIIKGG